MTRLRAGAATDVGLVRANNQDQLLVADPVFAVADGMGGHAAGEVASRTAVDALRLAFGSAEDGGPDERGADAVAEAVRAANRAVWDEAQAHADFRGMGTTLTAIALVGAGSSAEQVAVVNVGDSRTYRLRDGTLEQLTSDHSYVAELVAEGQIDADEAEVHPQRHVLTRALGVGPDVDVDLLTFEARDHDRYLLCSDGLSREVTDAQMASVLRRLLDPGDAARELVAEAKRHGGSDNITVVVVDVVDDAAHVDEPTRGVPAAALAGDVTAGAPSDTALPDPLAPEPPAPEPLVPGAVPPAAVPPAAVPPAAVPPAAAVAATAATIPAEADAPTRAIPAVGPAGLHGPDGVGGAAGGPADAAPSRRERRRAARAARPPRARLVTVRVVLFFLLLVAIVAAAFGGTAYYARSTYFVGMRASRLIIFQGRPGGLLWWKPTVAQTTAVTTADIEPHNLAALHAGVAETSLSAARTYVANLVTEKRLLTQVPPTTPPTTATTVPPTTVTPTTVTPTTVRPRTSATTAARRTRRTTTTT